MKRAVIVLSAVVMCFSTAAASGNRLSFSNQNLRIVWNPVWVTFIGQTIRCDITLEASFHARTITKTRGLLIGYVTRAAANNTSCANRGDGIFFLNGVEVLSGITTINGLPWHIRYDTYDGTLENFTGVRVHIIGMRFLVRKVTERGMPACLVETTAASPAIARFNMEGTQIRGLEFEVSAAIPLFSICTGQNARIVGQGAVMLLGTSNPISITLI